MSLLSVTMLVLNKEKTLSAEDAEQDSSVHKMSSYANGWLVGLKNTQSHIRKGFLNALSDRFIQRKGICKS